MLFPAHGGTQLVLDTDADDSLPTARWLGRLNDNRAHSSEDERKLVAAARGRRGVPLLPEHSRGSFSRPGLRGHRIDPARGTTGQHWSTAFTLTGVDTSELQLTIDAVDKTAGLQIRTELQSLPGGALRIRHRLTNKDRRPFVVDALEVAVPLADDYSEILDFTGRHEGERAPQRHALTDGLWLREGRAGRPGLDAATMMIVGTVGFGFGSGEMIGAAVATSANYSLAVERGGASWPTISGGELLLPGEVVLAENESYASPWLVVVASTSGLDGLAAALHTWQRSLVTHPSVQPVNLNVWEAVHFDHDFDRLTEIADRAAEIGVERFVLDDGWFRGRRSDRAGLGDWEVDQAVWPDGLHPLISHVHARGMQFGLWIEPEMVNPDSDLFRAHPDWILAATPDRVPLFHRHQLVLDLTNAQTWRYLRDRFDRLLSDHDIDYVKWDHNRDLLEAGSLHRAGAPAAHEQNAAVYRLLDDLQLRHPEVVVEFCAAGGGRIDLAGVERVQRFWTSDMTDALARQHIQRWTTQLIAPEYLGAHVSAPTSLQTGRTFSLDFRAGTALFGSFGIEWDLTSASDAELAQLREWIDRYRDWRPVLHTGRVTRLDVADPAVLAHGVVATDQRRALFAHVQLDESASNRGTILRIPGLLSDTYYTCTWASPADTAFMSAAPPLADVGPTGGEPITGQALARIGLWIPRRRPETLQLIAVEAK